MQSTGLANQVISICSAPAYRNGLLLSIDPCTMCRAFSLTTFGEPREGIHYGSGPEPSCVETFGTGAPTVTTPSAKIDGTEFETLASFDSGSDEYSDTHSGVSAECVGSVTEVDGVASEDLKLSSDTGSESSKEEGSIGSGLCGGENHARKSQRSRHWLLKSESRVRQFGLRLLASGFLYFSTAYVASLCVRVCTRASLSRSPSVFLFVCVRVWVCAACA